MATRRLTIYLMRDEIEEFADALAPERVADEIAVSTATGLEGVFYRPPQVPRRPSWMAFIEPILAEELGDLRSSSVSGLLLLRVRGRIFALTFGYGRTLLDLAKIEHQFGLKVALNRIDPTQLRSLDTKTFEDMVVTTTTQVSKTAELPTFAIDVTTDILRAATGEPTDKAFAKRVSGADALVVNLEAKAEDLGKLCGGLLDAYEDDTYKDNFEWIDHLTLVRDSVLTDTLNEGLVAELAQGVTTSTHMALPEPINWEDIDAFKISGTRGTEYDDLDLDEYLAHLGEGRTELNLGVLKSRRVSIRFSRNEKFDSRWTVYQCLVSEQRVDGVLFVLIEGRWFKVSESLVTSVDEYVQAIPEPQTELLEAMPGEIEASYNGRMAGSAAGLISLDAKVKRPGGAASGIELCDILTTNHEFIHVKRKSRSATLSHLFAQGSVAANAFYRDGVFRDAIRDVIEKEAPSEQRADLLNLVPPSNARVDPSRYCVVFAVVANSARSGVDWLPFFSRLNLMQHARQLQAYGFRIAVARVPISTATP